MAVIAVDFDGVLHDPKNRGKGYRMGKPIEGALEAMHKLDRQGHILIILTARDEHAHVADWLDHFGFPYTYVTNVKPTADIYLDDRAVRFEHWTQALAEIFTLI